MRRHRVREAGYTAVLPCPLGESNHQQRIAGAWSHSASAGSPDAGETSCRGAGLTTYVRAYLGSHGGGHEGETSGDFCYGHRRKEKLQGLSCKSHRSGVVECVWPWRYPVPPPPPGIHGQMCVNWATCLSKRAIRPGLKLNPTPCLPSSIT